MSEYLLFALLVFLVFVLWKGTRTGSFTPSAQAEGRRKKEKASTEDRRILDLHFRYMEEIRTFYRQRNESPRAMGKAIQACENQIELAPQAREVFLNAYRGAELPAHTGFEQLAIIREKEGDFQEALRLCEEAKSQGWGKGCSKGPVDWDKRIERLKKKLSKA